MLYLVIFIFALIVAALLLICLTKVNIRLEYRFQGLDDSGFVEMKTQGGLILYRTKLPVEKGPEKEQTAAERDFLAGIGDKIANIREVYRVIKNISLYLREKITVREFSLNIEIGADDAFHTGMLGGLAWSAAGSLLSLVCNTFRVEKKHISVKPDFKESKFAAALSCIFRLKLAHIIIVAFKHYLSTRKRRKENKKVVF